jgi:hypothetical protein
MKRDLAHGHSKTAMDCTGLVNFARGGQRVLGNLQRDGIHLVSLRVTTADPETLRKR